MITIRYLLSASMVASALVVAGCSAPKSDGAAKHDTAQEPSAASVATTSTSPAPGTSVAPPAMIAALPPVMQIVNVEGGGAASEGELAPSFSWKGADGAEHNLKEYRGKVVMLNFWGTWCPPCRAELPDIVKIREELAAGGSFEVIGLNVGEQTPGDGSSVESAVGRFAQQKGIHYPLILASDDLVAAYGGIEAVPTTFILNKKGEIVSRMVGMRREEDFRSTIKKAM